MNTASLCLKPGYVSNLSPKEYRVGSGDPVDQRAVYQLARQVFDSVRLRSVLDVGCGGGRKLVEFWSDSDGMGTKTLGLDRGSNLARCRRRYPERAWRECDLERDVLTEFESDWRDRLVICADVIEHLTNPTCLLTSIAETVRRGSVWIVSTPERDLVRGRNDSGPPANRCHVQEWNLGEFFSLMNTVGVVRHAQLVPWRPDAERAETMVFRVEGTG